MVSTLCLFTCVLATAQPAGNTDWLSAPRLKPGQELVYSGMYTEQAFGKGIQYSRAYRIESRVLTLDALPRETLVILFTTVKQKSGRTDKATPADFSSVRLEPARIDAQGRVRPENRISLQVPLDGPSLIEWGGIVEVSHGRLSSQKSWETTEDSRPPRTWHLAGTEGISGSTCIKVVGIQQTEDWDKPRADRMAWRRRDTVWLLPGVGIAVRVERVIERREAAHGETTNRSVTLYNLESKLVYPGPLFEDRRREILQFQSLAEAARNLVRDAALLNSPAYEALQAKLTFHCDNHPATPYRDALLHLQRRLDAAHRGDITPMDDAEESSPVIPHLALGQPAPDFVATDLKTGGSIRLRRLLGKPIVMVFYSANSKTAAEVLRFVQSIADAHGKGVSVLGLAVTEEKVAVLKQREQLRLTFPMLAGQGLKLTYGVDGTPKLVVLDADGIVRGTFTGWGIETEDLVTSELNQWLGHRASK